MKGHNQSGTCCIFLLTLSFCISMNAPLWAGETPGQQNDSTLFQLNIKYLNGVNEFRTPYELIPIIEEILELDPGSFNYWFNLGMENIRIKEYDRSIRAFHNGLEYYPDSDNRSLVQIYISLSFCYYKTGRTQQEHELLNRASVLSPGHPSILGRYMISAHSRLRYAEEERYRQQLVRTLRDQEYNESDIAYFLGSLYLNEDYLVAEEYFRTACQYDPDNIEKQGALAWVLIKNALKIDEGMQLMARLIEADPENAVFVHQQGYGYYIKGDLDDALALLYGARDLYQQFSFELNSHILIVEDAIASLE
jgi:tetratricopeptide (TPR) repeat protein